MSDESECPEGVDGAWAVANANAGISPTPSAKGADSGRDDESGKVTKCADFGLR